MLKLSSHLRPLHTSQRGDTIVEVLIATGIITLVLASAYAITNRNSLAAQDTQEHMRAARLVESQIEALRTKQQTDITLLNFCIDTSDASLPLRDATDTTTYPCTIDRGSGGAEYALSITKSADRTYKVTAKWKTLVGNNASDADVTMYYRTAQ